MNSKHILEYKFVPPKQPSEVLYEKIYKNYLENGEYIIKKISENSKGTRVVYLTNTGNWIQGIFDDNVKICKLPCNNNNKYSESYIKCIQLKHFYHSKYPSFKQELNEFFILINGILDITLEYTIDIKNVY